MRVASPPIRIAVVDPNTAVRTGLPLVLPSCTCVAGYASGAEALMDRPAVDVLVLDVNTGGGDRPSGHDIDTVAAFASAGYRVCLYTLDRRPYFLERCLTAGARGVVLKSDPLPTLVACLRQIARGGTAVSGSVVLPRAAAGAIPQLTERQRDVLAGRARGESFHKIAHRLAISERTAQDHWSAIARHFREFLLTHSPADLERSLGLDPGVAPLVSNVPPRGRGAA